MAAFVLNGWRIEGGAAVLPPPIAQCKRMLRLFSVRSLNPAKSSAPAGRGRARRPLSLSGQLQRLLDLAPIDQLVILLPALGFVPVVMHGDQPFREGADRA